jgi:hypothetical protein
MGVNIKGTFKKDDKPNNGLESIIKELTAKPHERRLIVGIVRPARTVIDHADGSVTPTVQFDHIEVPLEGKDGKSVWEVLAAAYEARTGNPLPPQSLFDNPSAETLEGEQPLPGMGGDDDGADR